MHNPNIEILEITVTIIITITVARGSLVKYTILQCNIEISEIIFYFTIIITITAAR